MPRRELVRTKRELGKMLLALRGEKVIAADTETTGLDWQNLDIAVGVSFAIKDRSWYVALNTPRTRTNAPLEIRESDLHEFWDQERTWVWHNGKFDLHMLAVVPRGMNADTMLMATLLDPEKLQRRGALRLKTLAAEFLGVSTDEQDALQTYMDEHSIPEGHFNEVPIGILAPYACADAEYTLALYRKFLTTIKRRKLSRILVMETRLLPVVVRMEEAGVPLDIPYLKKMRTELEHDVEKLFESLAAEDVMGKKGVSPKKLLARLKADGCRVKNTAAETLETLDHPLAKRILEFRGMAKLHGTYVTTLLDKQFNGRVSMDFRQHGARTGRSSCAEPNLQNIPNRKGEGIIQRAFINPGEGWQMLYADYSQIEMVIFAEISGDRRLQEAVRSGADLHGTTGALLYGKDIEDTTDEERGEGKTMNFSIIYGQGILATAKKLGKSEAETRRIRARYFKTFPAIKSVQDRVKKMTKATKSSKTLFGRVRPIGYKIIDGERRDMSYTGLNSMIQGTAADIMKIALVRLDHYLRDKESKLLLCIHDEAMIQHRLSEDIIENVKALMTRRFPLKLPLRVDVKTSTTNWFEKKELES